MTIIFHVDMDAFFVACEILENPTLDGKPIVVGADPKGGKARGVVSTASYEARKFGVHSAMPISLAYKKCPDCVFLPVNFPLYKRVSAKIFDLIRESSVKTQRVSIDEAFFITSDKTYESAQKTAKKIKESVRKEGLTCSIGIGPNKIIAKIASDFRKPDGLTIIRPQEAVSFLAPMPVRKLPGVGPRTEEVLRRAGIEKIGDITPKAAASLGKLGSQLLILAQGGGSETIEDEQGAKSISREVTFQKDTDSKKEIEKAVSDMAKDLHATVSKHKASFKSVAVKVRYSYFETHLKQKTLKFPANDLKTITNTAMQLITPFIGKKKIRLIGVKVSGFGQAQAGIKKFV